ncbi:hypothetical protein CsatA_029262 [Cannabis sativa]
MSVSDTREPDNRIQTNTLRNDNNNNNNSNNTNPTNIDEVVLARLEKLQKVQDGMMQLLSSLLPRTHQEASVERSSLPEERAINESLIRQVHTVEQRTPATHDNVRGIRTSEIVERVGEEARFSFEFVTKDELIGLLKAKRGKSSSLITSIDFHPLYHVKVAVKPYPHGYMSLVFQKYNGKFGNGKEHIIQFIDDLGTYEHDFELRIREFSKSLTDRAYSGYASLPSGSIKSWDDMVSQFCAKFFMIEDKWSIADLSGERQNVGERLVNYVQKFREKALDCAETMAEKDLVKMCIKGMLDEYRLHIENHAIYNFAELIAKSRNTEATVFV